MSYICQACGKPVSDQFPCEGCCALFYCSEKHKKRHYKTHQAECRRMKAQMDRVGPALPFSWSSGITGMQKVSNRVYCPLSTYSCHMWGMWARCCKCNQAGSQEGAACQADEDATWGCLTGPQLFRELGQAPMPLNATYENTEAETQGIQARAAILSKPEQSNLPWGLEPPLAPCIACLQPTLVAGQRQARDAPSLQSQVCGEDEREHKKPRMDSDLESRTCNACNQRRLEPPEHPLQDWGEYLRWRGLTPESPAALLLQWVMTLYHALTLADAAAHGTLLAGGRTVRVAYLGPQAELDCLDTFSELAVLLPKLTQIHINFVGPDVPSHLHTRTLGLHPFTPLELSPDYAETNIIKQQSKLGANSNGSDAPSPLCTCAPGTCLQASSQIPNESTEYDLAREQCNLAAKSVEPERLSMPVHDDTGYRVAVNLMEPLGDGDSGSSKSAAPPHHTCSPGLHAQTMQIPLYNSKERSSDYASKQHPNPVASSDAKERGLPFISHQLPLKVTSSSIDSSRLHAKITLSFWQDYYHNLIDAFSPPDLIFAPNAGVPAYSTWRPTIDAILCPRPTSVYTARYIDEGYKSRCIAPRKNVNRALGTSLEGAVELGNDADGGCAAGQIAFRDSADGDNKSSLVETIQPYNTAIPLKCEDMLQQSEHEKTLESRMDEIADGPLHAHSDDAYKAHQEDRQISTLIQQEPCGAAEAAMFQNAAHSPGGHLGYVPKSSALVGPTCKRVPFVVTDYNEEACVETMRLLHSFSHELNVSEVALNPFRCPLAQEGHGTALPTFSNGFMLCTNLQ